MHEPQCLYLCLHENTIEDRTCNVNPTTGSFKKRRIYLPRTPLPDYY